MKSSFLNIRFIIALFVVLFPALAMAQDIMPDVMPPVLDPSLTMPDLMPSVMVPELPTVMPQMPTLETPSLDMNTIIEAIPNPPGGGDVMDVPVDGGLSILLAAGAGYGLKKMRQKK